VVVDVYAKNLPKDAVSVQLTGADSDQLRICVKAQPSSSSSSSAADAAAAAAAAAEEEDYVLELDLFGKVRQKVAPWTAFCRHPCLLLSVQAPRPVPLHPAWLVSLLCEAMGLS
jgi:hypothetical protein